MPSNYTDISSLISPSQNLQPVSYGHPEKIPSIPRPEVREDHIEIHEVVEHEPDQDVQPYVEPYPEKVKVPQDLQNMGVESTGHTQFPTYDSVKLPISDERVLLGLHKPISSSLRWLAEFCIFLLKRAHIRLRAAHGKAVRMFSQ